MPAARRLLFRVDDRQFERVEIDSIFYLEATGGDTLVRTARRKPYRSSQRLADLRQSLPQPPFFSPHRSFLVNLDRVRLVRRRTSRGWELKLDPPVGAIIPVARGREEELFALLRT